MPNGHWCRQPKRACLLVARGKVFHLENCGHSARNFPGVDTQKNPVNAPDRFLCDGMCAISQPSLNGGFAGSGAFADLLQPHRVLAGVAATNHTECEIGYALRLLVEAAKKTMSVVHKRVSLGPVRAGGAVLPTSQFLLGAPTFHAGPLAEVPDESVLASGNPGAFAASPSPGKAGYLFLRQKPSEGLSRHPQSRETSLPRLFVVAAGFASGC